MTWSPELEPYIRLGSFLSIFVVMALWEEVIPWVLSASVAGSLLLFALSSVASCCLYETRDL